MTIDFFVPEPTRGISCHICETGYVIEKEDYDGTGTSLGPWRPTNCPHCGARCPNASGRIGELSNLVHYAIGIPIEGAHLEEMCSFEYEVLRTCESSEEVESVFERLRAFDALEYAQSVAKWHRDWPRDPTPTDLAKREVRLAAIERFCERVESGEYERYLDWLERRVMSILAFEREHHLRVRAMREAVSERTPPEDEP